MWQLYVLFFEFVNWNSGNVFVHLLFFCGMERFFAIALLPVLQSHCDKIAITHMRQGCNHAHAGFATGFFCNRSTSAVATTL
jgi:hypothetical protein